MGSEAAATKEAALENWCSQIIKGISEETKNDIEKDMNVSKLKWNLEQEGSIVDNSCEDVRCSNVMKKFVM